MSSKVVCFRTNTNSKSGEFRSFRIILILNLASSVCRIAIRFLKPVAKFSTARWFRCSTVNICRVSNFLDYRSFTTVKVCGLSFGRPSGLVVRLQASAERANVLLDCNIHHSTAGCESHIGCV
jgi:hypothetical protein